MLHITNGDCATAYLQKFNYAGQAIAWQDVLHDGPLTMETDLVKISDYRNIFLAHYFRLSITEIKEKTNKRNQPLLAYQGECEIALWITPELFDALIMLQFLTWYKARGLPLQQVSLVFVYDHLPPENKNNTCIQGFFEQRQTITQQQLHLAEKTWAAVVSCNQQSSAEPLEVLLQLENYSSWPGLRQAMRRYQQELPKTHEFSRTQQQILRALNKSELSLADLFQSNQQQEEFRFIGDWSFWNIVDDMREYIEIDHKGHLLHKPFEFYKKTVCRLNANGEDYLKKDKTFTDRNIYKHI